MWPELFGPGWEWGALLSLGILGAAIGLFNGCVSLGEKPAEVDPLQRLWREYEEGGVTRWEFERLRKTYLTTCPASPDPESIEGVRRGVTSVRLAE